MPQKADCIALDKLPALCRLIGDDVGVPGHVRISIVSSLIQWWEKSKEITVIRDIQGLFLLLADSSVTPLVIQQLLPLSDAVDPSLRERTLALLQQLPLSGEASTSVLIRTLATASGPAKWRAATALSELGLPDGTILEKLQIAQIAPSNEVSERSPVMRPVNVFDLNAYRLLYEATRSSSTSAQKGTALEVLTEYIFLCIPGLNSIARNLRTLTEEIDIAVSNGAGGFWREIGNPFVVECKNISQPVDAAMIRNFRVKLQTKGLKGGFIITSSRLSRDAMVEMRQALSEGRFIVALEGSHLADVANGQDISALLEERFYTCRLL